MTHTTNYNLNLPAGTDPAAIEPLNQNFELIDRYIKANLNNMAEDYDSSETYNTDDIVAHDNAIYKCLDDGVTGIWDATKWDATTLGEEVGQGGGGSSVVVNPSGEQDEVLDGLEVEGVNYGLDVLGEISDVAVASFSDGADLPLNKCIINVEAVQDLHGYDHPWVGGAGKNKLPMTMDGIKAANTSGTWSGNAYTYNGITFDILTDDNNVIGIKCNGIASAEAYFQVSDTRLSVLQNGRYIANGCPSGGSASTYRMRGTGGLFGDLGSGGVSFEKNDSTVSVVEIIISNGYAIPSNGLIFYPMIRLATESDSTFAPYSNICPISGWSEANLWIQASVDPTADSTATVDFGQDVYGGSADLLNGVLSDNPLMEVFDNTATVTFGRDGQTNWYYVITSGQAANVASLPLSNQYVGAEVGNSNDNLGIQKMPNGYVRIRVGGTQPSSVDAFVAALGVKPLQVLTPITGATELTFAPIPTTNTLEGVNNVYADCGNINTLGYFKDGKLTRSVKAIVEAMTGDVNAILADAIGEE